jgi:catechol O-methyltransferase
VRSLFEIGGRRAPFLRRSALSLALAARRMSREGRVDDGREEALLDYVREQATEGDLAGTIAAIDRFCYERAVMMNVGDEKGAILESAVARARSSRALELGAYCGYSALRIIQASEPGARLYSIERSAANAAIARAIIAHAGVADRVSVIEGALDDRGATISRLRAEHGLAPGCLDFLFIDHDKLAYVLDLERVLECRWLRPGAIVVADNIRIPGAPAYRSYMRAQEGRRFRTREHRTHLEYQSLIRDLMLESEYLGG